MIPRLALLLSLVAAYTSQAVPRNGSPRHAFVLSTGLEHVSQLFIGSADMGYERRIFPHTIEAISWSGDYLAPGGPWGSLYDVEGRFLEELAPTDPGHDWTLRFHHVTDTVVFGQSCEGYRCFWVEYDRVERQTTFGAVPIPLGGAYYVAPPGARRGHHRRRPAVCQHPPAGPVGGPAAGILRVARRARPPRGVRRQVDRDGRHQ